MDCCTGDSQVFVVPSFADLGTRRHEFRSARAAPRLRPSTSEDACLIVCSRCILLSTSTLSANVCEKRLVLGGNPAIIVSLCTVGRGEKGGGLVGADVGGGRVEEQLQARVRSHSPFQRSSKIVKIEQGEGEGKMD